MGLDMYLKARRYYSGYDFTPQEEQDVFTKIVDVLGITVDKNSTLHVDVTVGYWRKANAIHKWFVDNVQLGTDDCGTYYVSKETLKELLDLCKETLEWLSGDKTVDSPLPSQGGFFFGSTDYDEWYKQDIEETIEILTKCLQLPNEFDFFYESSW